MADHYRKDHDRGITAPNPDAGIDMVSHITKHRGMTTQFTSVSEDRGLIRHFSATLYITDSDEIAQDGHEFITHPDLIDHLKGTIASTKREERVLAARAFQMASRVREALVDWRFDLERVERKNRITWCFHYVQLAFRRLW